MQTEYCKTLLPCKFPLRRSAPEYATKASIFKHGHSFEHMHRGKCWAHMQKDQQSLAPLQNNADKQIKLGPVDGIIQAYLRM